MGTPKLWEYEDIANNILSGEGFQKQHLHTTSYSQTTPIFPFLCAGIYALTNHSHLAMQLFLIILSCLIALLAYWIAKFLFNRTVGLLAAFLVVLHPGLLFYSIYNIHPLNLDSFLMLSVLLAFLITSTRVNLRSAFMVGCIAGIAILSRPTIILFLPLALIWLALSKDLNRKGLLIFCSCLLVVTTVIISTWTIRNYFVYKRFIFVTTDTGELLWRGNNPIASGSALLPSGESVLENMPEELAEKIYGSSELEQMDIFKNEGLGFIISNPAQAAKLIIKKFYYFWWFSPQSGLSYSRNWFNLYRIYYISIISFAILSLIKIAGNRKSRVFYNASLLILLMLSIALAHSIFYVEGRHRWAIEPLILIFAANGLIGAINWLRPKRKI